MRVIWVNAFGFSAIVPALDALTVSSGRHVRPPGLLLFNVLYDQAFESVIIIVKIYVAVYTVDHTLCTASLQRSIEILPALGEISERGIPQSEEGVPDG